MLSTLWQRYTVCLLCVVWYLFLNWRYVRFRVKLFVSELSNQRSLWIFSHCCLSCVCVCSATASQLVATFCLAVLLVRSV